MADNTKNRDAENKNTDKGKDEPKGRRTPFIITAAFSAVSTSFAKAVSAFNTQDGTELSKWLDPEVVLFRNKDGGVIAQGHDNVLAALEVLFVDKGHGPATFKPSTSDFRPASFPVIVSGSAAWHDNDGSPDDTIKYEFVFNPGNSLLISLWAQHK